MIQLMLNFVPILSHLIQGISFKAMDVLGGLFGGLFGGLLGG